MADIKGIPERLTQNIVSAGAEVAKVAVQAKDTIKERLNSIPESLKGTTVGRSLTQSFPLSRADTGRATDTVLGSPTRFNTLANPEKPSSKALEQQRIKPLPPLPPKATLKKGFDDAAWTSNWTASVLSYGRVKEQEEAKDDFHETIKSKGPLPKPPKQITQGAPATPEPTSAAPKSEKSPETLAPPPRSIPSEMLATAPPKLQRAVTEPPPSSHPQVEVRPRAATDVDMEAKRQLQLANVSKEILHSEKAVSNVLTLNVTMLSALEENLKKKGKSDPMLSEIVATLKQYKGAQDLLLDRLEKINNLPVNERDRAMYNLINGEGAENKGIFETYMKLSAHVTVLSKKYPQYPEATHQYMKEAVKRNLLPTNIPPNFVTDYKTMYESIFKAFQRGPKYPLLIRELLKTTPEGAKETFKAGQAAVTTATDLTDILNESVRKFEREDKAKQVNAAPILKNMETVHKILNNQLLATAQTIGARKDDQTVKEADEFLKQLQSFKKAELPILDKLRAIQAIQHPLERGLNFLKFVESEEYQRFTLELEQLKQSPHYASMSDKASFEKAINQFLVETKKFAPSQKFG